jgi:hypothetical protein
VALDADLVEDGSFAAVFLHRPTPFAVDLGRLEGTERPLGLAQRVAGGGDVGFGGLDRRRRGCAAVDGGAGVAGVGGAGREGICSAKPGGRRPRCGRSPRGSCRRTETICRFESRPRRTFDNHIFFLVL